MKGIIADIAEFSEKISDANIKVNNLDVLGITIPSSLEEVGIAGAVYPLAKAALGIKNYYFTKAFERFSNELKSLTSEQKINFINRYSKKSVQEFGEQALLLLNKIEMPLAATLIGRAHNLLVVDDINENEYLNYCHVIKNINLYIFKHLLKVYNDPQEKIFTGGVYSLMESLGLMFEIKEGLYPSDAPNEDDPEVNLTRYRDSKFGRDFFEKIVKPYI